MPNQLKVDTTQMQRTSRDYQKAIDDLEKARTNLEKAILALRSSGWKSAASAAYFKLYDDKWKKSLETHVTTLEHMRDSLDEAKREYDSLCDQAKNLGNSLA